MPGMLDIDAREALQQQAQDAYDAKQKAQQDALGVDAGIAWRRLRDIAQGGKPTRETNAEWQGRQGMLPSPPQTDPYFYYKLRNQLPPDSPLHATYGPLEHGQNMEEVVSRDPWMALPLGLVGIPGYTLGKATGMISGTRSPASTAEMIEAYKGLLRGLFAPQPGQQEEAPMQVPGGAYPGRNPPSFVRG